MYKNYFQKQQKEIGKKIKFVLKLMSQEIIHQIYRKEFLVQISWNQQKKRTLYLKVIMKKYPATHYIFQLDTESIEADMQSLMRTVLKYRTLHFHSPPTTVSLLLEEKLQLSCKDTNDNEKKKLDQFTQILAFGVKSWSRRCGRLEIKVDLHPHNRLIYIFLLSKGQVVRAAQSTISLSYLTGKDSPLKVQSSEDNMLEIFFQRLTQSRRFRVQWEQKTLKTNHRLLNKIKLINTIVIEKKYQDEKQFISPDKVQVFKHIFLTQLITHMIINQLSRYLGRNLKYRDGSQQMEYRDEQIQQLRNLGHRFSSFRDYPFKHKINKKTKIIKDKQESGHDDIDYEDDDEVDEEQSEEESDSDSEKQHQKKMNATKKELKIQKKKTKIQKMTDKIKNRREVCNFIFISGRDKAKINKKRYCLHQMTRQTDKNQALIDFLLLISKIVPKQERITDQIGQKSLVGNFMSQFKVKRDINVCFAEYTKNSFFHQILNVGLRVLHDPYELIYLRLPFSHVFWGIKSIYHRHKRSLFHSSKEKNKNLFLYRGFEISEKEIKKMRKNIGGYLAIEGFLSTSLSESVADAFVVNAKMVIEVDFENLTGMYDNGFANISGFSEYKREKQVLINALNIFKIVSYYVETFTEGIEIYILRLKYGCIKEIEEKIKESENLLDAKYVQVQNKKQYQKAKYKLEMHKGKISTQMYNKLAALLPKAKKQLQKREKKLKEWELQEYKKALQSLSKWEKQLIVNIKRNQQILCDLDDYGELLYNLSQYRKAEVYFRRKIKQIEMDQAIEGHEWWKSVRLVFNCRKSRLALFKCYESLAKPTESLSQGEKLLETYASTGVSESDPRYYCLVFQMYNIYRTMLQQSAKQEEYKESFMQLVNKYQLKHTYQYNMLMALEQSPTFPMDEGMEKKALSQQEEEKLKSERETDLTKSQQFLKFIQLQSFGKYSKIYLNNLQDRMENLHRRGEEEEALQTGLKYLEIRKKAIHVESKPHTNWVFQEVLHILRKKGQKEKFYSVCAELASFISLEIHFCREIYLVYTCLQYCIKSQWWRACRPIISKLSTTKVKFPLNQSVLHLFVFSIYALLLLSVTQYSVVQAFLEWMQVLYQQQGHTNTQFYKVIISDILYINKKYRESSKDGFIERQKDYFDARILGALLQFNQHKKLNWRRTYWEKKKGELIPQQHPFHAFPYNDFFCSQGIKEHLLRGERNLAILHISQLKNMYRGILNKKKTNQYLRWGYTITKLHLNDDQLRSIPKLLEFFSFELSQIHMVQIKQMDIDLSEIIPKVQHMTDDLRKEYAAFLKRQRRMLVGNRSNWKIEETPEVKMMNRIYARHKHVQDLNKFRLLFYMNNILQVQIIHSYILYEVQPFSKTEVYSQRKDKIMIILFYKIQK